MTFAFRYLSRLLYIRAKLMIVNDRRVIVCPTYFLPFTDSFTVFFKMGSANFNNHSQKVHILYWCA